MLFAKGSLRKRGGEGREGRYIQMPEYLLIQITIDEAGSEFIRRLEFVVDDF